MTLYLLWRCIRCNKTKGGIQGHNYGRRGGYSDIFWGNHGSRVWKSLKLSFPRTRTSWDKYMFNNQIIKFKKTPSHGKKYFEAYFQCSFNMKILKLGSGQYWISVYVRGHTLGCTPCPALALGKMATWPCPEELAPCPAPPKTRQNFLLPCPQAKKGCPVHPCSHGITLSPCW